MQTKRRVAMMSAVIALTLVLATSSTVAGPPVEGGQGSASVKLAGTVASKISYQGRLTDAGGNPLDGSYNLIFQLWDDASGGSQVGGDIVRNNVPVSNGLFTVELDVPQNAFNGQALWLRIQVNGQWLTPRQELLPVPYALSLKPGATISSPGPDTLHLYNESGGYGVEGWSMGNTGVVGISGVYGPPGPPAGMRGVYGRSWDGVGVYGEGGHTGVYGNGTNDGVKGESIDGNAVHGLSTNGNGVLGESTDYIGGYFHSDNHWSGWFDNGIRISGSDWHGIQIDDTSWAGIWVDSSGADGFEVGSAGRHGLHVQSANEHGVYVEGTGTGDGLRIDGAGAHGVDVASAGECGVKVYSAGMDGVRVDSANWSGVYVGSAGYDALRVQTAGRDGLRLFDTVGRDYIRAGSDADPDFRVESDGLVLTDRGYRCGGGAPGCLQTGNADVAERINAGEELEAGDVVEIDPTRSDHFRLTRTPYSTLVAGVISSDPAIVMGTQGITMTGEGAEDERPALALVGSVQVKASAENGPIRPGDLLVTSSTPGHAMRADDPPPGTILGKALGELKSGTGVIDILVTLQ